MTKSINTHTLIINPLLLKFYSAYKRNIISIRYSIIMNQQTLARMLRIQCVEKICDIDIPWFLIDSIESSLAVINSYKLTNLMENIDAVHASLTVLWKQYSDEVARLSQEEEPIHRHRNILQYLTNRLLQQKKSTKLSLSKTQAVRLNSVYTITCLMMLKEHMHKNVHPQTVTHRRRIRIESTSLKTTES